MLDLNNVSSKALILIQLYLSVIQAFMHFRVNEVELESLQKLPYATYSHVACPFFKSTMLYGESHERRRYPVYRVYKKKRNLGIS